MFDRPDQPDPRDHDADIAFDGAGNGFSGFVIARLAPDLPLSPAPDLRRHAATLGLNRLVSLLDTFGKPRTRRLITSVDPDELLRMEREAATTRWRPLNSLTQYWRIDARDMEGPPDELAESFGSLREVELAYAELAGGDPTVNAVDDPLSTKQGYLDAAPTGIDARWAWTQPGGEGQGINVVDLEQGWNLQHEDLAGKAPTLLFNANRDGVGTYVGDHGTAVLGEIGADDNAVGVVGVAPSLASLNVASHFDGTGALHVADAAVAAMVTLGAGDVLLIEVQRGAKPNYVPSETDVADFDAFRLATARGVTVVAASGNGNTDLDAWTDATGKHRLRRGHPDFLDSGAIMVGSCQSQVTGGTSHARLPSSNFGSRVDCHAWGVNVATTGYGELTPSAGPNAGYTGAFSGTSSASPIVVGAAVLTQSMYHAATGNLLSPAQLREILSDPANGTPQSPTPAGAIGPMPDLRRIGTNVLAVADVYVRDALGDSGVIPNAGALSVSPDIIVRPAPGANPTTAWGEGSGTENVDTLGSEVETGSDNAIYVRMRNRGAVAAPGMRATVYWSEVATLVTPHLWKLIGTTPPVDVPSGNTLVVTPALMWPREDVLESGHHCFVAILDGPSDPAPPVPGPTDWDGFRAFIAHNNNVTWRNFNIVDKFGPDLPDLGFLLTGAPGQLRAFDLQIDVKLPDDASVTLELPAAAAAALPARWSERLNGSEDGGAWLELPGQECSELYDVVLNAGAAHACRFVVEASKAMPDAEHSIEIRQYDEGLQVGGVRWLLRARA